MKRVILMGLVVVFAVGSNVTNSLDERIKKEGGALAEGVKIFGYTNDSKILNKCKEVSKTSLLYVKDREKYFDKVAEWCFYYAKKKNK